MTKICGKCQVEKPLAEFCKNKAMTDGLTWQCRACTKAYKDRYYATNKIILLAEMRERYAADPSRFRAAEAARRARDPAAYNARALIYQKVNAKKVNARHSIYERERRLTDIQFRLKQRLRGRINKAVRGMKKAGSAVADLGCSVEFLKGWLEAQFQTGMSWDNYGSVWHIDHKEPLSAFDLANRSQFLLASNYTNLQPLWASENIRKGGIKRKAR